MIMVWYFSHQSRIIPSCYKKDGFIVFLASSFHLRSTVSPISCLYTKWVSWLIVRGLFYPLMSISLGNLVSGIGRGTITYCSNTLNHPVWRTPLYQRMSRPEWIVRPTLSMAYLLNPSFLITTIMNFIPTFSRGMMSPTGVNSVSP